MGPGGFALCAVLGCFVRPWAAARLIDGVACGPTGVPGAGGPDLSGWAALCARGRWPARSPSALRASLGASPRSPARPRHRPRAPQPGPPVPPAPSTPVVPGRCCLVRRVLLQTSSIRAAYCAVFPVLVTNVVNPTAFLRKIVVFGLRLTTFVTRVLVRRFELRWFDDVCNVGRPLVARPGPAAAHGHRSLALSARWPACLKPPSPLRVPAEPQLKPPSPLRVRIGCFWRVFRLHWCCRFQGVLFRGEHW